VRRGVWLLAVDRARITLCLSRGLALGTISHGQGAAQVVLSVVHGLARPQGRPQ